MTVSFSNICPNFFSLLIVFKNTGNVHPSLKNTLSSMPVSGQVGWLGGACWAISFQEGQPENHFKNRSKQGFSSKNDNKRS
jgi:hypothetical protein